MTSNRSLRTPTHRAAPLLCTLGVLVLLSGCAPRVTPPAAGRRVSLTFSPAAPRALDPTTFTVRAKDAQGQAQTGATVTVTLTMPSMTMPKNEVPAKEQGGGAYVGTGHFTMPGDWLAVVRVAKGPASTVVPVRVTVR